MEAGRTKAGATIWRTIVDLELVVVNADKPEEALTSSGVGYGDDSQDKGPGKAYSYAMKTALQKLFLMAVGEEGDNEASKTQAAGSKQKAKGSDAQKPVDPQEAALKRMWAHVKTAGLTEAAVKARMPKGKTSTKTLTHDEVQAIVLWADTYLQQGGKFELLLRKADIKPAEARVHVTTWMSVDDLWELSPEQWGEVLEYYQGYAKDEALDQGAADAGARDD
jgi:hypothetical protein